MNIHEGEVNSNLEAEATARQLELVSLDGEVTLRQYSIADAPAAFALIDRNRKHLSKYGDTTARKYPTLESFQRSIEHPQNPARLRMGIWNKDGELVGSINLTPQTKKSKLRRDWILFRCRIPRAWICYASSRNPN